MADDRHLHQSADDQYRETPPGAGYEHTDAAVRPILTFLFWLAAVAILVHVGLAGMFMLMQRQRAEIESPRYPLAAELGPQLPPEPRLQRTPVADLAEVRAAEDAVLHSYGWVNRSAGVVRIPIDEAMRLTAERGLRTRMDSPGRPLSEATTAVPGIPSDASGGRRLMAR